MFKAPKKERKTCRKKSEHRQIEMNSKERLQHLRRKHNQLLFGAIYDLCVTQNHSISSDIRWIQVKQNLETKDEYEDFLANQDTDDTRKQRYNGLRRYYLSHFSLLTNRQEQYTFQKIGRLLESILEKIKNEQVVPNEFLSEAKEKDKFLRPAVLEDLLQSEFGRHISKNPSTDAEILLCEDADEFAKSLWCDV